MINGGLLDKADVLCIDSSKQAVIESDFYKLFTVWRRYNNAATFYVGDKQQTFKLLLCDFLDCHPGFLDDPRFRVAEKLYNNTYKRAARLRSSLRVWLSAGPLYFLTLTFTDKQLDTTSTASRRQYVSRFLSSLGCLYAANIDYGAKFEREHYHAVICVRDVLPSVIDRAKNGQLFERFEIQDLWEKKHGFLYVQGPIYKDEDRNDSTALAKYVTKLSNHALKTTGKGQPLLYSRKVPEWAEPVIYPGNVYHKPFVPTQLELLFSED